MISVEQIKEILTTYRKFDWQPRKVLLCSDTKEKLTESPVNLFTGIEIIDSEIDAIWFSRLSEKKEAWELRHLSATPFALFEIFERDTEEEIREETLCEMEIRLMEVKTKDLSLK